MLSIDSLEGKSQHETNYYKSELGSREIKLQSRETHGLSLRTWTLHTKVSLLKQK